ncbi:MAG: N-acetyl-gamma-glutamyl-phosphate reductase [bacterium]|nr:MAG: N-acetyl-gamma-glutamyl-phosphate reductase [bacterium]
MVRVGIIGATGYTGMELARILLRHPAVRINYMTSRTWAGKRLGEALPHLGADQDLLLDKFDAGEATEKAEFFFVCLPHGQSMDAVGSLFERGAKVVDLSADFRLSDPSAYESWYGEHRRKGLLRKAVYGLPELNRERIRNSRLVANPGCYPTSVILGLAPLLEKGVIKRKGIIADSKSGVSGAGREPRQNLHFPEVDGNFSAYNIAGKHRHTGEMEQELSRLTGEEIHITFSPHLLPLSRGIFSTIYCLHEGKLDESTLGGLYTGRYAGEPFVRISAPGAPLPSLKDVRGTNLCIVAPRLDGRTGTLVVISCLDNLVKGAAGQAVQNMNLMTGHPETAGLTDLPLLP